MQHPGPALAQSARAAAPLPEVPAFKPLYDWGCTIRQGELVMIAGASGSMKSMTALNLVLGMNLPTLYFSADMSAFTASQRVAQNLLGITKDELAVELMSPKLRENIFARLAESNVCFSFDNPITIDSINEELEAFVMIYNEYPKVIVVDNLMDMDGCESEYVEQMAAMQSLAELSRATGSTVIVLHHASDKRYDHSANRPPARNEIKGGMAEKPELMLTVSYENDLKFLRVAVVKQRSGRNDPTAQQYATLRVDADRARVCTPEELVAFNEPF